MLVSCRVCYLHFSKGKIDVGEGSLGGCDQIDRVRGVVWDVEGDGPGSQRHPDMEEAVLWVG